MGPLLNITIRRVSSFFGSISVRYDLSLVTVMGVTLCVVVRVLPLRFLRPRLVRRHSSQLGFKTISDQLTHNDSLEVGEYVAN